MPSQTSVAEREAEHTQQPSAAKQETEHIQQPSGNAQEAEQSQQTSVAEHRAEQIERNKIVTRSVIGGLSTIAVILLIAVIVLGAQTASAKPHFVPAPPPPGVYS